MKNDRNHLWVNRRGILSFILVGVLSAGLLAGCAGTAEQTADPGTDADVTVTETAETESPDAVSTVMNVISTEPAESSIYVQKIEGLSGDFIRGMDVSSLLAEEASGVKYYDADGNEADPLKILAEAGVSCIRVRVWNDPFDAEGHGYGGGNCTAETAAALGARAARYGMDTCVDFHYSDFWADPNKQMCPKAWEGLNMKEKQQALHDFTSESLKKIIDAGAKVSMVQIGNEINNGMAGEYPYAHIIKLLKSGSEAVREIASETGTDIKVAVHFTTVDDTEWIKGISDKLAASELDYDVFGVSYYPYWHGSMTNLVNVLKYISETHNVKTCVMETAYLYTGEDGDDNANSLSAPDEMDAYPIGVQGQANAVRDVCAAAFEAGAIGVFYWEGAWIPVPETDGGRSKLWEEYGSGWASSYSAAYDPDDAGKYYGGCSWDNQAFFDFDGHVLDSVNVFKYIYGGSTGEKLMVERISEPKLNFSPGDEIVLPDSIEAVYNDSACTDPLKVTWNESDLAGADSSSTGEYLIGGLADPGDAGCADRISVDGEGMIPVTATVTVANVNLLINSSFEEKDRSMWTVKGLDGLDDPTDYQNKSADAYTGDYALHFWDTSEMAFEIEQQVTVEKTGSYTASVWMQGGDFGPGDEVWLYVITGDGETITSDPVHLDGWLNWQNPVIDGFEASSGDVITVGAHVKCISKAWATFDDFSLNLK